MVRPSAINAVTKPGGTLIVTSNQKEDELVQHIHRRDTSYKLAIIPGEASFAGLWVYKDDGTDARCLAAALKAEPTMCSIASLESAIRENIGSETHIEAAREVYEDLRPVEIEPGQGNDEVPFTFELLKWHEIASGRRHRRRGRPRGFQGRRGRLRAGAQPLLQEMVDPHHASGRVF